MQKRGRKPSAKPKGYFYEEQEQAVLNYLSATTAEEKNEVYCNVLRPAFEKMVESIIRRYKLYIPMEEFNDTFNDTLSFLLTKIDKFKPGKYKAYSYYGTICKNYLLGRIDSYQVAQKRSPSYDESAEKYDNTIRFSTQEDDSVAKETVRRLISEIKRMVDEPQNYGLKESEIKIGNALVTLFENWEYVLTTEGSNKLNKNAILLFLREKTGLDTKGIRDNMKKFKKLFLIIKSNVID